MELIIIISVEITGIKLLPKIRKFNDVFLEPLERAADGHVEQHATLAANIRKPTLNFAHVLFSTDHFVRNCSVVISLNSTF